MDAKTPMRDLVHEKYRSDPLPNISAQYEIALYTKCEADEKEIAEIFIPKNTRDLRIGWLIPLFQ